MANENICVFCGEKIGAFRSTSIFCADTHQTCCKDCAKELRELSEEDRCRRALRLGYAHLPEKLEQRIELITKAEEHRPACLRCGAKLTFGEVQCLDNSPLRDSVFTDTFDLQPAYCESCGKIEFYHPHYVSQNKYIAFLINKDTSQ